MIPVCMYNKNNNNTTENDSVRSLFDINCIFFNLLIKSDYKWI